MCEIFQLVLLSLYIFWGKCVYLTNQGQGLYSHLKFKISYFQTLLCQDNSKWKIGGSDKELSATKGIQAIFCCKYYQNWVWNWWYRISNEWFDEYSDCFQVCFKQKKCLWRSLNIWWNKFDRIPWGFFGTICWVFILWLCYANHGNHIWQNCRFFRKINQHS